MEAGMAERPETESLVALLVLKVAMAGLAISPKQLGIGVGAEGAASAGEVASERRNGGKGGVAVAVSAAAGSGTAADGSTGLTETRVMPVSMLRPNLRGGVLVAVVVVGVGIGILGSAALAVLIWVTALTSPS